MSCKGYHSYSTVTQHFMGARERKAKKFARSLQMVLNIPATTVGLNSGEMDGGIKTFETIDTSYFLLATSSVAVIIYGRGGD